MGRGFLDKIDGSLFQCSQRLLRVLLSNADDENRYRSTAHLFTHECGAIHARHDQITSDDVRLKLLDQFQGFHTIAGGAHDFDVRTAGKHLADDLSGKGRIIDDQNADQLTHEEFSGGCGFFTYTKAPPISCSSKSLVSFSRDSLTPTKRCPSGGMRSAKDFTVRRIPSCEK